jgi:hypothetical protein
MQNILRKRETNKTNEKIACEKLKIKENKTARKNDQKIICFANQF